MNRLPPILARDYIRHKARRALDHFIVYGCLVLLAAAAGWVIR